MNKGVVKGVVIQGASGLSKKFPFLTKQFPAFDVQLRAVDDWLFGGLEVLERRRT
jgi:hypothetical protein